jgi:hypothetical protein
MKPPHVSCAIERMSGCTWLGLTCGQPDVCMAYTCIIWVAAPYAMEWASESRPNRAFCNSIHLLWEHFLFACKL